MKVVATGAAATAILALANAASLPAVGAENNLLINPSFEQPYNAGFPNYADLPGGSAYLSGWTTILNGVEVFTSTDIGLGFPWPTTIADGRQAVDLTPALRKGGGGIQQNFPTSFGQQYEITFDLGTALNHGKDGTGNVEVEVDGIMRVYTAKTSNPDWEWSPQGFTFTADDASATLVFRSFDDPRFHFASVDNVAIRAVPEHRFIVLYLAGVFLGLHRCLYRKSRR